MPIREIPDLRLASFEPAVAEALDGALVRGAVWVTDADGTLWDDDVGEGFLRWASRAGVLVHPEVAGGDAWAAYEALCAVDLRRAYERAVQWMAGLSESEVARLSAAFVRAFVPRRTFAAMRGLVEVARARGVETWIVSASHQWVVRAAAPIVGIDPARTIGVRVAVEDGVLAERIVEPFSWRAGKVEAIDRFVGRRPAIVTGDSSGDAEMLALARVPLVIAHRGADPAFVVSARERGWFVQALSSEVGPGE